MRITFKSIWYTKLMFSKRFVVILFTTVLLIYIHMFEEIKGDFYHVDSTLLFLSSLFKDIPQSTYFMGETVFRIMLLLLALITLGKKWALWVFTLYGVLLIAETDHLIKAIQTKNYYPGSITALLIVVSSFFYWKELLREWKKNRR